MKNIITISLSVLVLTACDEISVPYCEKEYEPTTCNQYSRLNEGVFEMCLSKLAEMRGSKGGNYEANDDEDLDEAIEACDRAASPYLYYQKICEPNPQYVAQQKFCGSARIE